MLIGPDPVPRTTRTRALTGLLLALPLGLAACGGGGSAAKSSPTASTSSPGGSSAATSKASGTGTLSKADFIAKADAVCSSIDTQVKDLPTPTSQTDYAGILADLSGTQSLFQTYIAQIEPLIAQSPDQAALTSNWLAVEKSDYVAALPAPTEMLQALQAKDPVAIDAAGSKLDSAPDHSADMATYLKSYGLTDCYQLESDQSN